MGQDSAKMADAGKSARSFDYIVLPWIAITDKKSKEHVKGNWAIKVKKVKTNGNIKEWEIFK